MKNFFLFLLLALVLFSFSPQVAYGVAADVQTDISSQLQAAGGSQGAGLNSQDPRLVVANIIRVALELLGTIAFVLVIYAGFLWMTAGGNDDKIGTAKKLLFQAVIGLVIILSAYSITLLVIKLALGNYTDYSNIDYTIQPPSSQCRGLSCP